MAECLLLQAMVLCYMSKDGKVKSLDKFPYSNNYDIVAIRMESAGCLAVRESMRQR